MIHVENLQVVRNGQTICAAPRFDAAPGERVAVLGPNGSGKTTLLRVLAGLECDYRGSRRVDVPRASLTYVHQHPCLFRGDVIANVAFGLRARGKNRSAAETEARHWLGRLGLAEIASRNSAALSGGERRRVAVARALALRPQLLLLDEPLAELDEDAAAKVVAVLADSGATMVIASPVALPEGLVDRTIQLEM